MWVQHSKGNYLGFETQIKKKKISFFTPYTKILKSLNGIEK